MSQESGQNYSARVAYDGTAYAGFQIQSNANTIQGELEKPLAKIAGEAIRAQGASRTDSGVHAVGQVISFSSGNLPVCREIESALNEMLPVDIRVSAICERPDDFHARFSAKGKKYSYFIYRGKIESPFLNRYATWIWKELDAASIADALGLFEGEHDFSSFSSRVAEGENPVKRIEAARLSGIGDMLRIDFQGSGFLYQMVRRMTGALIDLGLGKSSVDELREWLEEPELGKSRHVAPAKGLFLMDVLY